jgi:hypothetical protein
MARSYCGTFLVGFRRTNYVVIAADRLAVAQVPGGDPVVKFFNKIVIHPELPLAISVAGLGTFDDGSPAESDGIPAQELIRQAFDLIKKPEHLDFNSISRCVGHSVLPFVQKQRNLNKQQGKSSLDSTTLMVATCREGFTALFSLRLGETTQVESPVKGIRMRLLPTKASKTYFAEMQRSRKDFLLGEEARSREKLAAHARALIQIGIDCAREAHGGENRECGGEVDVAIIDRDGARFA